MVDRTEVRRIAALANLDVPEPDEEKLAAELTQILGYVQKLVAVDVTSVAGVTAADGPSALRDDDVVPSLPVEQALANAPARVLTTFSVPSILGTASE